jgi:hypothetical protein
MAGKRACACFATALRNIEIGDESDCTFRLGASNQDADKALR